MRSREGVEWSGVEWSGAEWSGVECDGVCEWEREKERERVFGKREAQRLTGTDNLSFPLSCVVGVGDGDDIRPRSESFRSRHPDKILYYTDHTTNCLCGLSSC